LVKKIFFAGIRRTELQYEYEKFGERNALEGLFSILKARLKRFWKCFPLKH